MSETKGPYHLRYRTGAPAPVIESFATLDEALDAVEARWETLRQQAVQVLDPRRILLFSTAELEEMMKGEPEGDAA
ncbi:MAG: hypothetical protein N3D18_14435 [Roseococcus sp.]|nr:hypothetical protein [Roseococcus sp.]